MTYVIQSIALRRDAFSKDEAVRWIREHGYSAPKVEVTPHLFRFRQVDPERLHGARFRTISLGHDGHMILAYV